MKKNIVQEEKTEVIADTVSEKIGDMIRNARTKKGIELTDVAECLRIRKVYLEAIEASDYEGVPKYPYGIGFVRSYAEFLGLNGARISDLYRAELNIKECVNKGFAGQDVDIESSAPSFKYIIISALAALAIYAGYVFFDKYYNDTEDYDADTVSDTVIEDRVPVSENGGVVEVIDLTAPHVGEAPDSQIRIEEGSYVEPTTAPTTISSATVPTTAPTTTVAPVVDNPSSTSTPTAENASAGTPETIEVPVSYVDTKTGQGVDVEILRPIWFEAKDEKTLYVSKIFEANTSYHVPDKSGMVISVGDFEAVKVYVNGQLVKDVFTKRKKTNVSVDKLLSDQH